MGILLNPENINFQEALNSEIYIDKTELISNTNKILRTEQKYLCVSSLSLNHKKSPKH